MFVSILSPLDSCTYMTIAVADVETNFPESGVSWSDGVSTIPGSQYQVHSMSQATFPIRIDSPPNSSPSPVLHRGSQLVRNNEGLWLQTENGSTVEDAAHNLLRLLKEREETGVQELEECKSS